MKTKTIILFGVLISLSITLIFKTFYKNTGVKTLDQNIARLATGDFHSAREAQNQIAAIGKPALPKLYEVLRTSTNSDQVGLCCYLIGEIDSSQYRQALMEFAVSGKIKVILFYPNPEAIRKLPKAQQKELITHLSKLETTVSKDEADCIKEFIQPLIE